MIKLNEKTYKELQQFATYFRQAYYGCYYTNLSQLKITNILEIVRRCGYVGSVTVSCNNCVLRFLRDVGEAYFNYEKSITEIKKNKKKTVIEEPIEKGDN